MRYIGIDYGAKRVGIAFSDAEGTVAFPHAVLANTSQLIDEVTALIKERGVEAIVMGESHNLAGKENPIAEQTRAFARTLGERIGLPVHFESELYTTQEARELPGDGRMNTKVDASAAALILTSFLEHSRPDLPPPPEPELY